MVTALPSTTPLPRLASTRLRRRAVTRLGATKVVAAAANSKRSSKEESGDAEPAAPAAKKPMTRKRMIDSLLRQSADKLLETAVAKSAKGGGSKQAKPPPAPSRRGSTPPPAAEGDVLDLSALLPPSAPGASRGGAVKPGGGSARGSGAVQAHSEVPNAPPPPVLRETWSYDTEDDVVKVSTAPVFPGRRGRGSGSRAGGVEASPVPPELAALLSRLDGGDDGDDGVIFVDEEFDEEDQEEEDDDEWDVDAAERDLEPGARGKTALQKVDVKDVDEIIDALGGLDIRSLDKESQAILQAEYQRKLQERDKLVKRVPDTDNRPPEGKRKTHRQLQIIVGKAANYKLWSPQDMNTRPMMSAVRAAVFSMLTALWHGNGQTGGTFPGQLRWLDLFAGTGAVGIEALSRGAASAHFVELDPWVIQNCLRKNLDHTQCADQAAIHNMTVEAYLGEAEKGLRLAGGAAFDMISVCPPYEKVSYPDLMATLERSPLVKPGTFLVVEYPKYEKKAMLPRIGRLARVRDRRYGRTLVAVYECESEDGSLLSEARAAERDRLDGWGVEEEEEVVSDAAIALRVAKNIELKRTNLGAWSIMRMRSKTETADLEALKRHVNTFAPSFTVVDDNVLFDADDKIAVIFFLMAANKDEPPDDVPGNGGSLT